MKHGGKHYYISSKEEKYKRKKRILITSTVILLLFVGATVIFSGINCKRTTNNYITAGICGAINKPSVNRLPINSCLADLIQLGNGVKHNADLRHIDLNTVLQNDSIYHIPFRRKNDFKLERSAIDNMPVIRTSQNKGEEINFFYVGYPALYFLINYNTKTNRTLVTYIPHSSLFLDNEYRLIDVYFTLGREYAIDMLSKSLGIKIDYYFIQDRKSFINMIDGLGGLDIDVDEWYAEEYDLKTGMQKLDGFHTFEYIRFIQDKTKRSNIFKGKRLELAYNLRQSRMKRTIKALFVNFKKSSANKQISSLASVMLDNNTETNIRMSAISQLVQQVVDNQYIDFETIEGYYIKKNINLYYIPTEWNSKKLRKQNKLDNYQVIKGNKEQILY